jgi:hypothetical protein
MTWQQWNKHTGGAGATGAASSWGSTYAAWQLQQQQAAQQSQAPKHSEWPCSVCGTVNSSKSVCKTCGCKKTWLEVAKALPATPTPPLAVEAAAPTKPTVLSTRDQLTALTEQLMKATEPTTAKEAPAARATTTEEIKEVQAKIRQLQATAEAMPKEEKELQESVAARIAALKASIAPKKLAGASLDSARAALDRARNRSAEAALAIDTATAIKMAADKEVENYTAEVEALETSLLEQKLAESSSVQAPPPLTHVQRILGGLITNMRSDPYVDHTQLEFATQAILNLVSGFEATLKTARDMKTKAETEAKGSPTIRLVVKQQSPAEFVDPALVADVRMRLNGKQPEKRQRLITDHFTKVVRKVTKQSEKADAAAEAAIAASSLL